jgi:hypothetical protein
MTEELLARPQKPTSGETESDRSEPPKPEAELAKLELAIKAADTDGVLAKAKASQAFGQYLLTLKKNRQLPAGVLDRHAKDYKVSRSTLAERRMFAEVYPTSEALEAKVAELSTRVESCRLWTALKKTLVKNPKPRASKPQKTAAVRFRDELRDRIESGAPIPHEDAVVLAEIAALIQRIKEMKTAAKKEKEKEKEKKEAA